MKSVVVQGIQADNVPEAELKNFWYPCMDSVRRWAKANGLHYYRFDKAIDPFDTETLLGITHRIDKTIRNGQFYKWQWVNALCDEYDMVYWIDGDVYAWGNPTFPETTSQFNCMQTTSFQYWSRPNLSLFWGDSETIRSIYQWHEEMFKNPSSRDDIFITLLTIIKFSTKLNPKPDFTEEIAFISWVYANLDRVQMHPYICGNFPDADNYWAFSRNWFKDLYQPHPPDSFLHFGGGHKYRQLVQFYAFRAYYEYTSKSGKRPA